MIRYLEHETDHYSLYLDWFGNFLLTRRSDGYEGYFVGDDAKRWRSDMDTLTQECDQSFDHLCSAYDDVLR
jgi:hypothetical protein